MEAKLCCFGIWMVAVLQIASADNSWLLRSITERQLMVASPSIQDGTVRATTILPRRDPLNSLQLYEGGFNMKDPHYWSSVAFTGMWAFSMAFLCLTVGIGASIWWFCDKDCGMASVLPAHANILRGLYCFCIVQFSILAITSSGVIFWGTYQSGKEIKQSTNVFVLEVDQVVNQVKQAVYVVEGATSPLMSETLVNTVQDACNKLNGSAMDLQTNFRDGKSKFDKVLNKMKGLLDFAAAMILMIVLIGLGKLLAPLHRYTTPSPLAATSMALLCLLVADMHISCLASSTSSYVIGAIVSAVQVIMGGPESFGLASTGLGWEVCIYRKLHHDSPSFC